MDWLGGWPVNSSEPLVHIHLLLSPTLRFVHKDMCETRQLFTQVLGSELRASWRTASVLASRPSRWTHHCVNVFKSLSGSLHIVRDTDRLRQTDRDTGGGAEEENIKEKIKA